MRLRWASDFLSKYWLGAGFDLHIEAVRSELEEAGPTSSLSWGTSRWSFTLTCDVVVSYIVQVNRSIMLNAADVNSNGTKAFRDVMANPPVAVGSGPADIHLFRTAGFSVRPMSPPDPFTISLFCSCDWSRGMIENFLLVFVNTQYFLNTSLISHGRTFMSLM